MATRLNTILLIPLFVAIVAACGRAPEPGTGVSFTDVAQSAARQEDRISVEQLAEWLIEERKDFVLIDVRSQEQYGKGKIHEARNIPLAELVTEETLAGLPADRKVIVYSNGSENAAKASTMFFFRVLFQPDAGVVVVRVPKGVEELRWTPVFMYASLS